ncbi:MAG: DUF5320 family protein [Bacteroidales bacterium]
MPNLDHKGPEGKGSKTGRGLGDCSERSFTEKLLNLGKGLGKRRKAGGGTSSDASRKG